MKRAMSQSKKSDNLKNQKQRKKKRNTRLVKKRNKTDTPPILKGKSSLTTKSGSKKKSHLKQLFLEIGVSLFVMVGLFLVLQGFLFSFSKVTGYGMTGTLDEGNIVFVYKKASIKRFDIICFRQPTTKKLMYRRVVGLPNEVVAYEKDELLINGTPTLERYLEKEVVDAAKENHLFTENFHLADSTNVSTLPKNGYFVLGDNRPYAADSRQFGWIEKKDIIGVVKARIFPLHEMTQF